MLVDLEDWKNFLLLVVEKGFLLLALVAGQPHSSKAGTCCWGEMMPRRLQSLLLVASKVNALVVEMLLHSPC